MKLNNVKIVKTVSVENMTVVIDLVEVTSAVKGEKKELGDVIESITIDANAFPAEVIAQATLHGLSQKFGDELACTADEKEATSTQEAIQWLHDLKARLLGNKWNAGKRSGNGKVNAVTAEKLGNIDLPEGMDQAAAMALLKQLGVWKG